MSRSNNVLDLIGSVAEIAVLLKGNIKIKENRHRKKNLRFIRKKIDKLYKRYKSDGLTKKEVDSINELEDIYLNMLKKLNNF